MVVQTRSKGKWGETEVVVEGEYETALVKQKGNNRGLVSRRALEVEADEVRLCKKDGEGKWEEYCLDGPIPRFEPWEDAWLSWRVVSHLVEHDVKIEHVEEAKAKIAWLQTDYNQVTQYFGPEVGVYFAWMNYFSHWLRLPAVLGLFFACRRVYVGVSIDDDAYVPFYSLFMVFWSTAFVAAWPQAEKTFGFEHGVYPELPNTSAAQLQSADLRKNIMYIVSALVTGLNLGLALSWHALSLNLQGYVTEKTWVQKLLYMKSVSDFGITLRTKYFSLAPSILHVLLVQRLNAVYRIVAEKLTELEGHDSHHDKAQSLAVKRFFFEAADAYATLFYLGFIQFDIIQLRSELVQIYSLDTLRRIALESAVPMLLHSFFGQKQAQEKEPYDDFDDYLEMIIEFGYLTLFASALPLGALFSLCANFIEFKNDVFKLLYIHARPIPSPEASLGVWRSILTSLVALGLLTNTALFAFTSEQLKAWVPSLFRRVDPSLDAMIVSNADDEFVAREGSGRYVVLLAFGLEHAIGICALVLYVLIPRCSSLVLNDIKRRDFEKTVAARALKKSRLSHLSRLEEVNAPVSTKKKR